MPKDDGDKMVPQRAVDTRQTDPDVNDGIIVVNLPSPEKVKDRTISLVNKLFDRGLINKEEADEWKNNILEGFQNSAGNT